MKKIYTFILLAICLIGIGVYKTGAVTSAFPQFTASNTSYACTPTANSITPLIATTTSRTYIRLTNTSAVPVNLSLSQTASSSIGIPLTNATGTNPYFETNDSSLFAGSIYCYSTSGTSTISVTEYK